MATARRYPRDAAAIYRESIEGIIDRKNNQAFDEAAGMVRKIKALMTRDGQPAEFAAWLETMRAKHKAKRNFMLAIDDFAIAPIIAPERSDLLELLDDRVGTRATLITSQLPVTAWHEWLDDPTLADAILDRIVHAAHKIALKGESMRKKQVKP